MCMSDCTARTTGTPDVRWRTGKRSSLVQLVSDVSRVSRESNGIKSSPAFGTNNHATRLISEPYSNSLLYCLCMLSYTCHCSSISRQSAITDRHVLHWSGRTGSLDPKSESTSTEQRCDSNLGSDKSPLWASRARLICADGELASVRNELAKCKQSLDEEKKARQGLEYQVCIYRYFAAPN